MEYFAHFNFNVLDLAKSMAFYAKAFNLTEARRKEGPNYTIVFLKDEITDFRLELTWLHDRTEPYDLGECEFHLALETDRYQELHALHQEMGCICFENPEMGIYFLEDPDGYWIEVVPSKKRA